MSPVDPPLAHRGLAGWGCRAKEFQEMSLDFGQDELPVHLALAAASYSSRSQQRQQEGQHGADEGQEVPSALIQHVQRGMR